MKSNEAPVLLFGGDVLKPLDRCTGPLENAGGRTGFANWAMEKVCSFCGQTDTRCPESPHLKQPVLCPMVSDRLGTTLVAEEGPFSMVVGVQSV